MIGTLNIENRISTETQHLEDRNLTETLNLANRIPTNKNYLTCIGSCYAPLALREDYRNQLRMVQREIGFTYIRFHGIFHDLMGAYSEDESGRPVFNFQNIYKIYDFFMSVGIKPFVELGLMPKALASKDTTVFHTECNTSPPKDYDKWAQLVEAFVEACIQRYGLEEVLTWRFEVWNEPDLECFWAGTMEDYFELYRYSVRAIKAIDERLMVGGPSTSKSRWIREMLDFCKASDLPIDFLTTHHYCADGLDLIVFNEDEIHKLYWRGQKAMIGDVETVLRTATENYPKPLELHYTEWNISAAYKDTYGKESEFSSAFVLETLKDITGSAINSYSYWTFSDIFEECGPGLHPISGKYGMITIHGVKKPVYHVYKFLADLYYETLPTNDSTMVTCRGDDAVRALAWNYCEPVEEGADYFGGEWTLDAQPKKQCIELEGFKGTFRIRCKEVSADAGNAYRALQAMGSPQYLSEEQVEQWAKASEPRLIRDEVVSCNGTLRIEHELKPCEVRSYDVVRI